MRVGVCTVHQCIIKHSSLTIAIEIHQFRLAHSKNPTIDGLFRGLSEKQIRRKCIGVVLRPTQENHFRMSTEIGNKSKVLLNNSAAMFALSKCKSN